MYQKVKTYAENNGFKVEEDFFIAYGKINGFFIVIRQDPSVAASHTIQLWASPDSMEPIPSLNDYLAQCRDTYKYLQNIHSNGRNIVAVFHGYGVKWGSEYVPCLDSFLKEITAYFISNQFVPCCESCGTDNGLNFYQLKETDHVLCTDCYKQNSSPVFADAAEKKAAGSGNVLPGLLGAIGGALLGAAVWVLIYQAGFISGWAGALMILLSFKGYRLLGGRLNLTGIVLCCVICAMMVLLSEYTCLAVEIAQSAKHSGVPYHDTLWEAFRQVPHYLTENGLSAYLNLLIGYALMAAVGYGPVKSVYKENSSNVNARMVAIVTEKQLQR